MKILPDKFINKLLLDTAVSKISIIVHLQSSKAKTESAYWRGSVGGRGGARRGGEGTDNEGVGRETEEGFIKGLTTGDYYQK